MKLLCRLGIHKYGKGMGSIAPWESLIKNYKNTTLGEMWHFVQCYRCGHVKFELPVKDWRSPKYEINNTTQRQGHQTEQTWI